MSYTPYFRKLSHTKSFKEIVDRTKDDNSEASEFTNEKFKNRKGSEVPEWYDDIQPAMLGKKPVKPEKGMRKFKGSDTIRKPKEDPDEVIQHSTTKIGDLEFEFSDEFESFDDYEE